MIDCRELALRLLDIALDDLSEQARAEVRAHLAHCPPCAALLAEYRAISTIVHDAMALVLSEAEHEDLDAAVLDAVARSA